MTPTDLSLTEQMFIQLVAVARADGEIHEKEAELLYSLGNRLGFSHARITDMFTLPIKLSEINIPDNTERFTHIMNIFRVAVSDGRIDDIEIKRIKELLSKMGYADSLSDELIVIALKQVV